MQDDLNEKDKDSALFFALVLNLSQSAMIAMGKIVNPLTGKVERDLDAAKASIDLLGMLKNKTRGNLNDKEQSLIDTTLTNLRLTYVHELEKPPEPKESKEKEEKTESEKKSDQNSAT